MFFSPKFKPSPHHNDRSLMFILIYKYIYVHVFYTCVYLSLDSERLSNIYSVGGIMKSRCRWWRRVGAELSMAPPPLDGAIQFTWPRGPTPLEGWIDEFIAN